MSNKTLSRLLFLALTLWTIAAAAAVRAETISVAAAISMKDALAQVAKAYAAEGGASIEFTFGSSGQLATQIQNGAPIDLFISAARKQMIELVKAGLVDEKGVKIVAGNALVLIVPAGVDSPVKSFDDLKNPDVKHIAIGQPKTVPAGDYAQQVLKSMHLDSILADKLVEGTNVRQVLVYVERHEADAGLVYATDAKESGDKSRVVAIAPEKSHAPIVYPAAVLKSSKHLADAEKLLNFIASPAGEKILLEAGFTSVSGATTQPAPAKAP